MCIFPFPQHLIPAAAIGTGALALLISRDRDSTIALTIFMEQQ
jgi:hypothetical protein